MSMTTIQKHGGQDNNIVVNFIEDFSVTTNFMGPSEKALLNVKKHLGEINHYPPQTYKPYIDKLYNFYFSEQNINHTPFMLLGNGASELIDLLIRIIPDGNWKPAKFNVQYLEYERSCYNTERTKKQWDDKDVKITCIINPNNPTGDYMELCDLKQYIEKNCPDNSYVIVDESMQYWVGPDFRSKALYTQDQWINDIHKNRGITVIIIHSMTKFWSCTGIRLGDMITYNEVLYKTLLQKQNPWSVNILALKYMESCIDDYEYMNTTWEMTKIYRRTQIAELKKLFPYFEFYGKEFTSWIWINTQSELLARLMYDACKYGGTPIRTGTIGYDCPSFIRLAVRKPEYFAHLIDNVKHLRKFPISFISNRHINLSINQSIDLSSCVEKSENLTTITQDVLDSPISSTFEWMDISELLCHEQVIEIRSTKLYDYLISIEDARTVAAIIVDKDSNVIIDGHHRYSVFKKMGLQKVPVLRINYMDKRIVVHPCETNKITKNEVIDAGRSGEYLDPKSTMHMIHDNINNIYIPIICMSPLCFIPNHIINV